MIRETSMEVFRKITENGYLGKVEGEVYIAIFQHGPLTIKECCRILPHIAETSVSPTFARLKHKGVVAEELYPRACRITGNSAYSHYTTNNMPIKLEKEIKIECPHCEGKGYVQTQQTKLF